MSTSVYELLKINESLMKLMNRNGIDPAMISQVEAYELYMQMVRDGNKKEYVYAELTRRFGMSRTTIFRLIRKMSDNIS